jgi:hypothetical protein
MPSMCGYISLIWLIATALRSDHSWKLRLKMLLHRVVLTATDDGRVRLSKHPHEEDGNRNGWRPSDSAPLRVHSPSSLVAPPTYHIQRVYARIRHHIHTSQTRATISPNRLRNQFPAFTSISSRPISRYILPYVSNPLSSSRANLLQKASFTHSSL